MLFKKSCCPLFILNYLDKCKEIEAEEVLFRLCLEGIMQINRLAVTRPIIILRADIYCKNLSSNVYYGYYIVRSESLLKEIC